MALLDGSYPGGLPAYVATARKLLADSRDGRNPFEGYSPSVPQGVGLDFASDQFVELEDRGALCWMVMGRERGAGEGRGMCRGGAAPAQLSESALFRVSSSCEMFLLSLGCLSMTNSPENHRPRLASPRPGARLRMHACTRIHGRTHSHTQTLGHTLTHARTNACIHTQAHAHS